ncbi:sirohydrochlorin chelatase [Streptomyces sp. NPDC051963]|uniref:sirohydrochlorin chelatase n=1 Tax=Streptomyces sp. NPDC051963 TaxID=3365678 RepID=UPI0037D1DCC3
MTASKPPHDESTTLDSTAHIMNRITSQLAGQLSRVSLDGRRRPEPPAPGPVPEVAPAGRTTPPPAPALVLVAHGSRDPRTLRTVTALVERVRELRPGLSVHLGHIELNEPLLPDALASLDTGEAILVPLLLSRGYHVKRDIPDMAAAAPARTRVAPALGPHPLLVEALYDRLVEAGWHKGADEDARGVVLAAAGSRDPESALDTSRTARLLADRLGVPVIPAYASAAKPTVQEAVRALTARGCHRVAVASYFTAPGYFATQCAEAAPWIASAPLGTHPAIARLLLHRYDQVAHPRGAGNCATSHKQPALAT